MKIGASAVYTPLPIDEWLDFEVAKQTPKANPFDPEIKKLTPEQIAKLDLNTLDPKQVSIAVEFQITDSRFSNRKAWKDFYPFWPKEGQEKTSDLFKLVEAIDPVNAVKGQGYDSANLVGKKGRLMMAFYESKKKNADGSSIIKQKVDRIIALKTVAAATTTATTAAVEAEASGGKKKVKF